MGVKCTENGTITVHNTSPYEEESVEVANFEWHCICNKCGKTSPKEYNIMRCYAVAIKQGWIALKVPKVFHEDSKLLDFCTACTERMSIADLKLYRDF